MDDANRAHGAAAAGRLDRAEETNQPAKTSLASNPDGQALRRRACHGAGRQALRQPELISRATRRRSSATTQINVLHSADRSCGCFSERCLPLSSPRRRPRRDLSRAHPRRRLRRPDHRQLDRLAEDRHDRRRSLRARDRSRAPGSCRWRSVTASHSPRKPTTTAAPSTAAATWCCPASRRRRGSGR